jgi:hypothetical protein
MALPSTDRFDAASMAHAAAGHTAVKCPPDSVRNNGCTKDNPTPFLAARRPSDRTLISLVPAEFGKEQRVH